jgi:hypothetical protein
MTDTNGNGVKISNQKIYDLLLEVRDIVLEERERRKALTTQVRALYVLWAALFASVISSVAYRLATH